MRVKEMASHLLGLVSFLKRQEKPFKVNLAKNIVENFSLSLTDQYQSIYITALGADPVKLGYVNSVGGVAGALTAVPVGWLADRFGIRRILLMALPLMALGSMIFALSKSWEITALAFLISALSLRMEMTVCPMICGNTLKDEERVTGMQLCDTLSALPRLIAPLVAAQIITFAGGLNARGIRPLYWLRSLGVSIGALIIYLHFTNPIEPKGRTEQLNIFEALGRVFREGRMVKRWILLLVLSVLPFYLYPYFPLYAKEVKNADQYVIAGMNTASTLIIVLLSLPTGNLADRFGRKRVIFSMMPLYCASLLLLIYAPTPKYLLLAGLLNGFNTLIAAIQGAITVEIIPRKLLGSWFGILGLIRGLVGVLTPLIGGYLWKVISPSAVFHLILLTQLVKVLILLSIPSTVTRG